MLATHYKSGFLIGVALLLSACGGSSDESSSPSTGSSSGAISTGGSGSSAGGTGSSSGAVSEDSISIGDSIPPTGSSSSGGVIQAGTLTAGDYDDLLNDSLYQDYISDFLQNFTAEDGIPYVDVANKIAIAVTDQDGNPVFGAKVTIPFLANLTTPVNGIVNLYPTFDQLQGHESLEVMVSSANGSQSTTATLTQADLGDDRTLAVSLPITHTTPTQLDIALVLDATGSMADEIAYLQVELTQVFKDLNASQPNLSIQAGLVNYRDEGDAYVYNDYPFTEDLMQFETDLNAVSAGGGGDYPEAMDQAMDAAINLMWRENSIKILLLVADAPPHDEDIMATWSSAQTAREEQIHIVPVAASGVADTAEFLMRSMAALTNSRYIFLTDDSGVGDEHAEPSVDCYVVTRLDSSIARVMASLISGERVEPTEAELIRTSGNYNNGVCEPLEETTEDDTTGDDTTNDGTEGSDTEGSGEGSAAAA